MSDLSLMHYNPKKNIIVASDSNNLGLEAAILHKENNSQYSDCACIKNLIAGWKKVQPS